MSDDKPSISELQRLRAAMTNGTWEADERELWALDECHPTYDMRVMLAGALTDDSERIAINRRDALANAEGTVALVNAAPALLELACAVMQRSIALAAIDENRSRDWDDVYKADLRIKVALANVRQ